MRVLRQDGGSRPGHHGAAEYAGARRLAIIYICSYCTRPTCFDVEPGEPALEGVPEQVPGAKFGGEVAHLPDAVAELHDEARRCMAVWAYTSVALACRKVLMNVAVAEGFADQGGSFEDYVEALAHAGYVPPKGRGWLDRIRKLGNEATHEIAPKSKQDAETVLAFTEMLLKLAYEYPAMASRTPESPVDT